jgi:HAD superfamily hydrolase (TIGR01509 family)
MNIQFILFDLDGVLVDACDWHYQAFNDSLLEICNVTINKSDHGEIFNGLPTSEKLKILEKQGKINRSQFKDVWELKQKNTINIISKSAQVDGEKISLHNNLKNKGIKSACVTNSIRKTAELMLKNTGQIDFFEFIISNEDVNNSKPHSEPYIRAMIKLKAFPENTLIVEDSDKGYQSAIGTGAHVLRVKNSLDVTWDSIRRIMGKE